MDDEYRKPEVWCAFAYPEKYEAVRAYFDRFYNLFDREEVAELRKALKEEIDRRIEAFRRVGAEDYERYCFMEQTGIAWYHWFPRLFILIDDSEALFLLPIREDPEAARDRLNLFPHWDGLGIRVFQADPVVKDPEALERVKKMVR